MKYLYRLAIIMGIGAACHAMLYTPTFDPWNMWSWAYLMAWPVMLIVHAFGWLVWLIIAIVVIVCLWLLYEKAGDMWWDFQSRRDASRRQTKKGRG